MNPKSAFYYVPLGVASALLGFLVNTDKELSSELTEHKTSIVLLTNDLKAARNVSDIRDRSFDEFRSEAKESYKNVSELATGLRLLAQAMTNQTTVITDLKGDVGTAIGEINGMKQELARLERYPSIVEAKESD